MKRIIFAALILGACARVEAPMAVVSFGAAAPGADAESKVAIDSEGKNSWVAGDKITIYYDGGSVEAETSTGGATSYFTTSAPIPTDKAVYCAVYPSTRNASFDGSDVTVDFSQQNEAATIACSAIATAKTTTCGGLFRFRNTGSILRFTTTSKMIHEARFYGGNGTTVSIVGSNSDARVPYASGDYYIPVPCGTAPNGFSLRLKNYDGEDYPALYRPIAREFQRSHIYKVGTVEEKLDAIVGEGSPSFRLMSFNILRGDLQSPNDWSARKDACLAMVAANDPDILCLQECTSVQRNDILEVFPKYGAVGISVEGGKIAAYPKTSSNPILYDGNKFRLENWGTFWLSETPDVRTNTWYYDKPRTATWAQFCVRGSEKRFVVVSTHLQDNSSSLSKTLYDGSESDLSAKGAVYGPLCRGRQVQVIVNKLPVVNPSGYPAIICGDCNEDGTQSHYEALRQSFLLARLSADVADKRRTFNGFSPFPTSVLDNIFYNGFLAHKYAVDRNSYAGRTYISDHYPVYADLTILSNLNPGGTLGTWDETDI